MMTSTIWTIAATALAVAQVGLAGCQAGDARADGPGSKDRRAPAGGQPAGRAGGTANPAPAPAAPNAPAAALEANDLGDGTKVLGPITHANLTILPVIATTTPSRDDYLVLDEGMDRGLVKIGELDDDGSVNELELRNRSELPLFVMAGEVIVGGKQDRIIGKNTVVAARTTQTIPVFCVEHGRWSGRRAEFKSAGALAHAELRAKANFEDQGQVWSEVSSKNLKRKTSNGTDTYRQTAAQQSTTLVDYERRIGGAIAALPAADRDRLVGFAVALNGEVVGIDVFSSPRLLAKLEAKLLRSYYAEAIDAPLLKDARAPGGQQVREFLTRADDAPEEDVLETQEATTSHRKGKGAASTKVMKRADADAEAPAAEAKPIYKSAHKH